MSGPGSAMVRAGGLQLGILLRRCSARAGQGHSLSTRGDGGRQRWAASGDSWWSCQLVMVEAVSGSLVSNSQGHGRGWVASSPARVLCYPPVSALSHRADKCGDNITIISCCCRCPLTLHSTDQCSLISWAFLWKILFVVDLKIQLARIRMRLSFSSISQPRMHQF